MSQRPETTLFMLMSLDGKISSGDSDALDVDRDWKRIHGVKEGLQQYYDLEQKTDLWSLNTGRTLEKIGVNEKTASEKSPVRFVVVDNKPHLTFGGVRYLSQWLNRVVVVTTCEDYPASSDLENVFVMQYDREVDFTSCLTRLKSEHGVERLTVQSGGTMNAQLIREGLIDHVSVVIAPLLVGGRTTSTLMDGEALHDVSELASLKALTLRSVNQLKYSYVHLHYDVANDV